MAFCNGYVRTAHGERHERSQVNSTAFANFVKITKDAMAVVVQCGIDDKRVGLHFCSLAAAEEFHREFAVALEQFRKEQ